MYTKGQLISKWLFGNLKNEQRTSALVARANVCKFFVRFLEELRFPKGTFEINWPLGGLSFFDF